MKQTPLKFENNTIYCQGCWTTENAADIVNYFSAVKLPENRLLTIATEQVTQFDTAGLWLLQRFTAQLSQKGCQITAYTGLSEAQQLLMQKAKLDLPATKNTAATRKSLLYRIGYHTSAFLHLCCQFLSFLGELSFAMGIWIRSPRRIRFTAIAHYIETTGLEACGIVALLSFLIGLVLTYQVGHQLENYGASIYVVDLLGISLLREFSPLITAIIVAGRSGSAFAAHIGTMQLNEEVDALKTMGVPVSEVLVLPKVLGLLITLPLLTILAICFGLLGGMCMAKALLSISFYDFLHRFGQAIAVKTFLLGEIKTPVFALLIAAVGCFQGFCVRQSASSVGKHTTISVVHGIFLIIVTDAIFSILYSLLKI